MGTIGRPRLYPELRTTWREGKRRLRKAQQQQHKVYHRALTIEWATPGAFFAALDAEFHFTLDVRAILPAPRTAWCRTGDASGVS